MTGLKQAKEFYKKGLLSKEEYKRFVKNSLLAEEMQRERYAELVAEQEQKWGEVRGEYDDDRYHDAKDIQEEMEKAGLEM